MREGRGERYPEVRVTQLEGLFQNQHGTGFWELDCLPLLQLDSDRARKLLEQSGGKSLGIENLAKITSVNFVKNKISISL